ncbi:MAG TPA: guanylate kinase [Gemmataceae bacterium]|jgi:guanylate kinase|nr:guanylate kinase [Gemmataceae bacterium]
MSKGPLIIVSGPSGSGKSTVIARLLQEMTAAGKPLHLSVSATTRAPRKGEVNGVHYHFWTSEEFAAALAAGEFLEHAEVHGARYGTLRREVDDHRAGGDGVVLDIDVQGAAQIRKLYAEAVSVFLCASTLDAYEQRLRKRGTETEEGIRRRLAGAQRELARAGEYDYQVINDDLDKAVADLRGVVEQQFHKG